MSRIIARNTLFLILTTFISLQVPPASAELSNPQSNSINLAKDETSLPSLRSAHNSFSDQEAPTQAQTRQYQQLISQRTKKIDETESQPAPPAVSKRRPSAVKMMIGDQEVFLKRARAQERASGSVLGLFTPFGRSKGKAVFRGKQARLRVTEFPISFEASLPADVHPDEYIVLLRLKSKKDRREIETSSAGFSLDFSEGLVNAKDGFREKDLIPLQFEEAQPIDDEGNILYKVTIPNRMETGEYALFHQEHYYDFSFDNRIPTVQNTAQQ